MGHNWDLSVKGSTIFTKSKSKLFHCTWQAYIYWIHRLKPVGAYLPQWYWILLQYYDPIGKQKQRLVKVRSANVPYLVVMEDITWFELDKMTLWIFSHQVPHMVHEGHLHCEYSVLGYLYSFEKIVEYINNITMHVFIHKSVSDIAIYVN